MALRAFGDPLRAVSRRSTATDWRALDSAESSILSSRVNSGLIGI